MQNLNAFLFGDELVSIISENKTTAKVITASGEVKDVPAEQLVSTSLINGGIYNNAFFQSAIGGLQAPPSKVYGTVFMFPGKLTLAFVEPISKNTLKYGAGGPPEMFGPGEQGFRDSAINKDKAKDVAPYSPNPVGRPEEGSGQEDVDSIPITDETELSVQKLTIEWKDINEISIDDIKSLFGEDQLLPEPDKISIITNDEKIVRQKTKGTKSTAIASYENPREKYPVFERACRKCQLPVALDTDEYTKTGKLITVCPSCNEKVEYETSGDQGKLERHDREEEK